MKIVYLTAKQPVPLQGGVRYDRQQWGPLFFEDEAEYDAYIKDWMSRLDRASFTERHAYSVKTEDVKL